jgi:hypothetical protein
MSGNWIPAFAGMTTGFALGAKTEAAEKSAAS